CSLSQYIRYFSYFCVYHHRLQLNGQKMKAQKAVKGVKERNTIMATLTVNIDNEKDLPVLKEILNRFGLKYKVDQQAELSQEGEVLYRQFKKTFKEIKDWEAGKVKLQPAKEALAEIEAELDNGV